MLNYKFILVGIFIVFFLFKFIKNKKSNPLIEDIPIASEYLVKYFKESNIDLDYSTKSIEQIDKFIDENIENGNVKPNSKLSEKYGYKIFAISSYVGEVLIRNSKNAKWITDDNDVAGELNITVEFENGGQVFPAQKVMKRIKNGSEDGLDGYVYLVLRDNK